VETQHETSLWSAFSAPGTRDPLHKREDGLYSQGGVRAAPIVEGIAEFVSDETQAHFGLQWNRFAAVQLDSVNGTTESRDRLLEQSGLAPTDFEGKTLLEVGCGAGRFTELLLEFGARVVSTDYSTAVRANRTSNGAAEAEGRVVFARADVFALPFSPQTFDIVLCYGVVQHTGDATRALRELWKMVAPGGLLLVDRYRLAPRNFLPLKYLLRPATKRLPPERLLVIIERAVGWLFPRQTAAFRRLQGSGPRRVIRLVANRLTLNSVFPVNLHVRGELDRETALAWSILDTFDMYGPRYDMPQSFRAFRRTVHELPDGTVQRCVTCGQGSTATVRRAAQANEPAR
jgi:2-polyprenyl-3-methyl-5-hydroxy-6-metoxy-1,4-benzoquinol methylase